VARDALTLEMVQAAIARSGAAWEAGSTSVSDLSDEEFLLHLGYVPGPNEPSLEEREQAALRNIASPLAMAMPAGEDLPRAYDLRNVDGRNFITPVKHQHDCGSCVAHATVAAAEGTLKVALSEPDLDVDYSEAHLFYCHARREGSRCDGGWWVDRALEAFKNSGVVDERCYPYIAGDQDCSNLCSNSAARLTFIDNWRRYVTAASMKIWLTSMGPLIACMSVYEDFKFYPGGVYSHVIGDFKGGHCVCIIGYDDDQGCWIAKNSWGQLWGENGFFRIAYGNVGIDAEMWTVEGVRSPAALRDAAFVAQSAPAAVLPGQSYNVAVTMRNVGIQTWTPGRQYKLGSQSPQDNETWGLNRVDLPGLVAPWEDVTFSFPVTAPAALPAHFQWRMLQEGVEWFGESSPDVVAPVAGTSVRYGATVKLRHAVTGCSLHSHPFSYGHPGSSGQQQVTCFAGADENDFWQVKGPDGQPVNYRSGQPVQNGDIIRLTHVPTGRNLHSHTGFPSPVTGQQEVSCYGESGTGDSNDNWRVEVDDGGQWDAGNHVRLIHAATDHALHSHGGFLHPEWTMGQQEVTGFPGRDENDLWLVSDLRARDAQFIAQSVPASLVTGEGRDVTVTMRNVGTETWAPGGQYRLGSQSPQDNHTWGTTRVNLALSVAPGQDATFSFRITAPLTTGLAHFRWRMLQEGVEWFGEYAPYVGVQIFQDTGPTTVPDVEGMPRVPAANKIRSADLVPAFTGASGNLTEVVGQYPAADSIVARGTTVALRMESLV
jgi:C1A family cysteine protease